MGALILNHLSKGVQIWGRRCADMGALILNHLSHDPFIALFSHPCKGVQIWGRFQWVCE
jgi:hypothetical protein